MRRIMRQLFFQVAAVFILAAFLLLCNAANLSHLVKRLPGQPEVPFEQYAGHVAVNEAPQRALFYWFYTADHPNASSLPLLLWLNGGPGCSSIGLGAVAELGPFRINKTSNGLNFNPYAWNRVSNLLFLESPHGVGFSYSKAPEDQTYFSHNQTAADNLAFLIKWLEMFPEYKASEFYLAGESFAGQYVPIFASHILDHNKNSRGPRINFKGFALGNGFTSEYYEAGQTLKFYYTHSLISKEAYEEELESCYLARPIINQTKCDAAMSTVNKMVQFLDPYNVYGPGCNPSMGSAAKVNRLLTSKGVNAFIPCVEDLVTPYMNMHGVQAALNVENRPVRWEQCSGFVFRHFRFLTDTDGRHVLRIYEQLFKAGIKIWIYSGDFDSVVPTMSTRSWINALNLTIEKPWYPWKFNKQVGGWSEVYSELTFVTFRGSGHLVPTNKPREAMLMIKRFFQGVPLPPF